MMSGGRSLARAGVIVMFLNGLAIVAAFAREATIAYYYGASAELDAFWVALSVPRFVGESLVVATVTALIPVFAKIRAEEGEEAMVRKASNLASVNLVGLAVFVGGYVIAAPFVIKALAPGFESYRHNLAVRLTVLIAPITLLWGALGILKALHNTYRRFTYPELARVLLSVGIVAALVVFASRYGIYAMVAGFIGGLGLAMLLNTVPLSRLRKMLRLRLDFRAPEVRRYLAMLLPVLATSGIYYIQVLVGTIFASGLEAGSVSALRYASMVVGVPVALIGGALATVLYPEFADTWATDNKLRFEQVVSKTLRIAFLFCLPLTSFVVVNARPIISLLFERGRFTAEAAHVCSTILAIYVLNITASVACGVLNRVFYSTQRVSVPLAMTALGVGVNAVACALLTPLWGVLGIAASLPLTGCITLTVYLLILKRSLALRMRHILSGLLLSVVVAGAVWASGEGVAHLLQPKPLLLLATTPIQALVFLGCAYAIGAEELFTVLKSLFPVRRSKV